MKLLLPVLLIALVVLGGCATNKEAEAKFVDPATAPPSPGDSKLLVTPVNAVIGKVVTYNAPGRFVVLDFPIGRPPALEQTLFVYRQGLKVGEVKITGPERDNNTVADLVSGEAQRGDEVRDQ